MLGDIRKEKNDTEHDVLEHTTSRYFLVIELDRMTGESIEQSKVARLRT